MARFDVLGELIDASHHLPPDALADEVRRVAASAGFGDAVIYLADYSQRYLMALTDGIGRLEIDTTVGGRAFRVMEVVAGAEGQGGRRMWVPILDGTDRLGVLAVTVSDESEAAMHLLRQLAGLVALVIVSKAQYGDGLRNRRRVEALGLAAELRWAYLPPLTVISPGVAIAGILEPAYSVAGDTFDYALNGPTAHVAVFDAVGHGLDSARVANLAMAAYRNLRHQRSELADIYSGIDRILSDELGEERFVTAQLVELDVPSGRLSWLNAGHPPPILLRRGRTHDMHAEPVLPMGLSIGTPSAVSTYSLEPDDKVLLFTDGMVEARAPGGEQFGRERLADVLVTTAQSREPVPEMVRRLVHAVLSHVEGSLRDDATALLIHWLPPEEG